MSGNKNSGRKKLPTHLKLLKGTARKGRMNPNEVEPDLCIPEPPKCLDRIALNEWIRISKELFNLGILGEIDRTELASYCDQYSIWYRTTIAINKLTGDEEDIKGLLIRVNQTATSPGSLAINPLMKVKNTAAELMHKFLVEFGMTPASRSKANPTPKKNEGKKDKYSEGGF